MKKMFRRSAFSLVFLLAMIVSTSTWITIAIQHSAHGSTQDVTNLLESAIANCYATGECDIQLPRGDVSLSRTINMCPTVTVRGTGTEPVSGTYLLTSTATTAFRSMPYEWCKKKGYPWHGVVQLKDLRVQVRGAGASDVETVTYGFDMIQTARISNVKFIGGVVGIRMFGDAVPNYTWSQNWLRSYAGGQNLWRLDEVTVQSAEWSGILIAGADSNAGLATHVYSGSNCQFAGTKWAVRKHPDLRWYNTDYPCAGIVDASFLGNTWVAPITSSNYQRHQDATGKWVLDYSGQGYLVTGDSQRSVLVGAYAESDQQASWLSLSSNVFGGIGEWSTTSKGLVIVGYTVNRFRVINKYDPANVTYLEMGDTTYAGGWLTFRAMATKGGAWPLTLRAKSGRTEFSVAGGAAIPMKIDGTNDAGDKLGRLHLKSSLLVTE